MPRPETPVSEHEGYHFEPVVALRWRLHDRGMLCRRTEQGYRCREAATLEIDRAGWRTPRPVWWAYCETHAYDRWVEDGQVMQWRLVPDEGANHG